MAKIVTRSTTPASKTDDGFYEALPGYVSGQLGLQELDVQHDSAQAAARNKMWRQLIFLGGLLIIQLVLFAVLISSVANLG